MFLSICIPTFNRSECLKKTLSIFIDQVYKYGFQSIVEFNISDNGSSDNTYEVVNEIVDRYPELKIVYKRNNMNIGPDKNFIQAMNMASGLYSILWSDDDYLREGALDFIIKTLKENPEASVFLSNRNIWVDGLNDDGVQYFVRESVDSRCFDFSNIDEVISYFSCVNDIGGLFTYIPSVIYRTEVIELYKYDGSLDGTFYAFMFYWWQYLMHGRKLMYLKTSYIDCTISGNIKNTNFGEGIYRVLVDYEGLIKVAERLNLFGIVKEKFLECLQRSYSLTNLIDLRTYSDRRIFDKRMIPALIKSGLNRDDIISIITHSSLKNAAKKMLIISCPMLYKCIRKIYHLLKA